MPFVEEIIERFPQLSVGQLVASAGHVTVECLARDLERYEARRVIVSGGGAFNPALVALLTSRLPQVQIEILTEMPNCEGVTADNKEAVAFAVFAVANLLGLPVGLPAVTGATSRPLLGSVTRRPGMRLL